MRICVYCSSSGAVAPHYVSAASELGTLIAHGGHSLVFGGGDVGLMGAVSRAARRAGAHVTGVIPRFMTSKVDCHADTVVVTETMRERKARMEELSDAFIALPGGFGTLEEILEIVTNIQLGLLAKPAAFVSISGFYDPLVAVFETLYREKFTKPSFRSTYAVVPDPASALKYVGEWKPAAVESKWFT
jgi:cytokinin riboside 5'-monophosphate phosphoribohydrolase